MKIFLTVFQIIISIILCVLIFLQSKGDSENSNILSESSSERRGWEKMLYYLTIIILIIFLISSIIQFLI